MISKKQVKQNKFKNQCKTTTKKQNKTKQNKKEKPTQQTKTKTKIIVIIIITNTYSKIERIRYFPSYRQTNKQTDA